jgi:Domain of unknown function (DUF4055)
MAKKISEFAHPEYLYHITDYQKIRDCYKGERAVKAASVAYLPRLKAQSEEDYHNYLTRALFFPVTGKTVTTMVGLATVKPPKVVAPEIMEPYFKDSESGYQFSEFYVTTLQEMVLMGRYGVLIDAPENVQGQPILCPYIAENIINWDSDELGRLTMLLLRESRHEREIGSFETSVLVQYRHCYLDSTGIYTVEVLDEDLKSVKPPVQPTFTGSTIDFIPWVTFGASGVHIGVDKPPMLDISTINISHYLTSADLEWGRHIVGLPTPVVSGVDSGTNLSIGGTAAWILPVVEAKAYYLEFQGLGLKSLEIAMSDKISLMSSMSARLVDNSTRGSEAAETVRLRYMSESAGLIHIIGSIETGCNILYNMLAKLLKTTEVTVQFSKEILGVGVSFKDLKILFEAYLTGSLSKETLVYNLRRLDAISPNRTDEEELSAIKEPPTQAPAPTNAPKPAATSASQP